MRMRTIGRRAAGILLFAIVAACGASSNSSTSTGTYDIGSGGSGTSTSDASTTATSGSGGSPLPPEKEVESDYQAPVATGHYVWIANPTSGRVAYIDASTLEVKLVDAGNGPTQVASVPDPNDDVAIVMNVLSNDA